MIKNKFSNFSACELGIEIAYKNIDPVELTEYFLELIYSSPPASKLSFIKVLQDRSIKEAKESRNRVKKNRMLGPLDGVPCAWKDLFDVKDHATSAGSKLLVNNIAQKDAEILQISKHAGQIFLGKTSTVEFALGGIGTNKNFPCPPNLSLPGRKHVPGGSSAGSASAVSGGLAPIAVGTDTGGSVRIPAAWQGLVGLKTSHGLISLKGVVPLAQSLDTIGPLCKNVEDAYTFFKIATRQNFSITDSNNIKNYKIFICKNLVWDKCEDSLEEDLGLALDVLRKEGADIDSITVPEISYVNSDLEEHGELVLYEAWNNWNSTIAGNEELVDPNVLYRMNIGKNTDLKDINILKHKLNMNKLSLSKTFRKIDVLVMPTVCINPPLIMEVKNEQKYNYFNKLALRNTRFCNVLNLTAISIPIPTHNNKMPVGLMLCSSSGNEKKLLKLAKLCEEIFLNNKKYK